MHSSQSFATGTRRRRLPTLSAAVAVAVGCSSALAASASAAVIAVSPTCVVQTGGKPAEMAVAGTGFTPGDEIDVATTKGGAFGTGTADTAGNIGILLDAPLLPVPSDEPYASAFTMSASDALNPLAVAPTATFWVANLAVKTTPAVAKFSKRVTWRFSGFLPGKPIYAHYLHGNKLLATRSFGRGTTPCGTLEKKAVFLPVRSKYSTYRVQVDNSRRYSKKSLPRWIGTLQTRLPG